MNKKAIIASILCLGLISTAIIGTVTYVKAEGSASANVINAAPVINNMEIRDTAFVVTSNLVPNAVFYLNVSIVDPDGIIDVQNTTGTLNHLGTINVDNPIKTYRYYYNETLATNGQVYPLTGNYLNSVTRTTFGPNMVNYSFEVILNKTAIDTNGVANWRFHVLTQDSAGTIQTKTIFFVMGPYVELTYWGNAGGMDFNWIGSPETNQSAGFNTFVTTNDHYELNCSYTGAFQAPWGSPTFWIYANSQATNISQIPDVTSTPGVNTTWILSVGGPRYDHNTSHTIWLVFPAGIVKGTSYTGVTIWIQAKND